MSTTRWKPSTQNADLPHSAPWIGALPRLADGALPWQGSPDLGSSGRQSYDLNEHGLFETEYADAFGVPFDFTAEPVIVKRKSKPTAQVHAAIPMCDACTHSPPPRQAT